MVDKDKIIVALDFPDFESAKNIVEIIGDQIGFYKIGLEMMVSSDYFKMIEYLKNSNKKVFADLKLYDIPETVGRAVKNLSKYDIDLLTIHASSRAIMTQAVANKGNMDLLAVTALTCLDQNDLNEMGLDPELDLSDHVVKKAKLAIDSGVCGVVASAQEAKLLRDNLGNDFKIVTPGIRFEESKGDDQKRVTTPASAIASGADYLVIGRPITRADDPRVLVSSL